MGAARKPDLGDGPARKKPRLVSGFDYLADGGFIRCAFSTSRKTTLGMGGSTRTRSTRVMWYVEQVDDEAFEVRRVNNAHVPAGNAETIPLRRLLSEFTPEPAYYEDKVIPAVNELEKTLNLGDEHRARGRLYSAEMEYDKALSIEERNVRALFGLGLVFLERGEKGRTRTLLGELVQVKAAFDGKNQHLFNEFGIALRKSVLFDEAVTYYRRALDFVTTDENLYYNLARAHYENGNWEACLDALVQSNRLNPRLEPVHDLLVLMVGLAEDERRLPRYGKPHVPREMAERARKLLDAEDGAMALDEAPVLGVADGRARSGAFNGGPQPEKPADSGDD
ncbi:MAG: tetratricopeptide repeat protein [Pseudodesulfovibrio sp.]